MRMLCAATLFATVGLAVAGCAGKKQFEDKPSIDSFTGRVTQDGKPMKIPQGQGIQLMLIYEDSRRSGIPLDADGKFDIGKMPIGRYSVMLERPASGKGPPMKHNVPGGLVIVDGKTDYTIELGKDLKF
jgi:hypothetical protein